MIHINLIPRDERVRRRTLPAIKLPGLGPVVPVLALAGVAATLAGTTAMQQREISRLESDVTQLRVESERFKPQLEQIRQITQKRQEVRNRLDIIGRLDQDRYFRVKLMDEVAHCLPDNMWLSSVEERSDRTFSIEGVTFSNFIVARFMKDLEAQPHWQEVGLSVAQQGKITDYDVVQFSLVSGAQP